MNAARRPILLALRARGLGDLLMTLPALRGLRSAFPDSELVLAAPPSLAPLVPLIGGINRLLGTTGLAEPIPLGAPATVAVNLHGHSRESYARLEELSPAHRIGHRAPGWAGPAWDDTLGERERWVALMHWHGLPAHAEDYRLLLPEAEPPTQEATIVHVGTVLGGGRWPVERFAAVARQLSLRGHAVLVSGGAADRERALAVAHAAGLHDSAAVAGRWQLTDFAAAIAFARALVTADAAAGHLAAAYGTPSVVIGGLTAPGGAPPPGAPQIVLSRSVPSGSLPSAETAELAARAVWPGHVLDAVAMLDFRRIP